MLRPGHHSGFNQLAAADLNVHIRGSSPGDCFCIIGAGNHRGAAVEEQIVMLRAEHESAAASRAAAGGDADAAAADSG